MPYILLIHVILVENGGGSRQYIGPMKGFIPTPVIAKIHYNLSVSHMGLCVRFKVDLYMYCWHYTHECMYEG